jgi:Fic family protein
MPGFTHHELRLLNPRFDSPMLNALLELEHLRRLRLESSTPPSLFFQLKALFHRLESLASARIEGNHTTLADYLEQADFDAERAERGSVAESIQEIQNIERAMALVEADVTPGTALTHSMLLSWHAQAVFGLQREGDKTPGAYRTGNVSIAQAEHLPPQVAAVRGYMDELIDFVNRADPSKYDLMKVALAHHRFVWIHPFGNGNGRLVRLFTHAMLIKYGFRVQAAGGLVNPAAVFCADRNAYYTHLSRADLGDDAGLEQWCTYTLQGILAELRKVQKFTDYATLAQEILVPAVEHAKARERISANAATALRHAIARGVVKSSDVAEVLPNLSARQRTHFIATLVDSGLLAPIAPAARQYTLGLSRALVPGLVEALRRADLVSPELIG